MQRFAPAVLLALFVVVTGCAVSGCATPAVASATDEAKPTLPPWDTLQVKKGLKTVYGVGKNAMRQGVGEGLFFANRLVDSHDKAGIAKEDRIMVVAIYDEATEWVLNEAAWSRTHPVSDGAAPTTNHSAAIVQQLIDKGVHVEVCGMTMKKNGWTKEDLLPGVVVVPGAYSRIVDLQHQGFASVSFF